MKKYLLEIGTEELPAGQIADATARLQELFSKELSDAGLSFGSTKTFSTPRRLAILIEGLADRQPDAAKKTKGPPVSTSFDASGKPLPAATGFADKHGLKVEQLDKEDFGGKEHLVANVTVQGKPAAEVLQDIAPRVICFLSFERPMRWGSSDMKFSRPIRWIVSILDSQVVPFHLDGMQSGNETYGHRILSPGKVQIANADEYVEKLKSKKVIACADERQEIITREVEELARSVNGKAKQLSGSLLEEVVNLTEWPHALIGKFSEEYLTLPGALLETVMVHHQRYFPVEKSDSQTKEGKAQSATANNLLPYFIAVSNNNELNASKTITQGNERVLKARLADGKFFYFDDQKTKLSMRKEQLGHLTYQQNLGTYKDKTERLSKLAGKLSKNLSLEPKVSIPLESTMELFKLDLVTNLVHELPELQGYVGSWYAELEGEPKEVVRAIASHYSPRDNNDTIPDDTVGRLVGVLDKVDHVTGLFALGKKPSGSSDPFALRRNTQGLVDIVVDGLKSYRIDINWMIDELLSAIELMLAAAKKPPKHDEKPKPVPLDKIKEEIQDFITQRLRGKLLDMEFSREIVEAVLSARNPLEHIADTVVRCRSLDKLIKSPNGLAVVRGGVRIGNILKPDSPDKVDESKLAMPIEKELWQAFNNLVRSKWETNGAFRAPETEADYDSLLELVRPLSPLIDKFFDDVMVNDQDMEKRNTRHAILKNIDRYFSSIAMFSKLQPILPTPPEAK